MSNSRLIRVRERAPLLAGAVPWLVFAVGAIGALLARKEAQGLEIMSPATFIFVVGVWAGAATSVGGLLVCVVRFFSGPRNRTLWFGLGLCLAYQLPLLIVLLRQRGGHV